MTRRSRCLVTVVQEPLLVVLPVGVVERGVGRRSAAWICRAASVALLLEYCRALRSERRCPETERPSSRWEGEMADGAKMRAESLENKHVHEHQLTDAEQKVMESFETLDYDVCENALYRERNRNYSEAEERTRNLMYWCVLPDASFGLSLAASSRRNAASAACQIWLTRGVRRCPGSCTSRSAQSQGAAASS